MLAACLRCHECIEVPDELLPDNTVPEDFLCGACDPDEQADWDREDDEPDVCPFCGKEYEEFSDMGCGHCDQRSPEWGTM